MSKTITSGGVAFIDLTDSRKLDAYITSNLPTTQIYNQNTKTYTPNWSSTNLKLSADIYLDSKLVTSQSYTSIIWYQKIGTQTRTQVGTGSSLTINGNQLSSSVGIITYICEATYNDTSINPPTAHAEIVFTRVDTGLNGSNGADGTSVTIDGTAYYNGTITQALVGQKVVLYADTEFKTLLLNTKQMEAGDSYIVQGYLCVYSPTDNAFICTGTIQGPKGDPGENAKSIILNGNSQVFKVSKTNVITPATITVTAQTINTSVTTWTYSTNGGQTFLSTVPTGVSRSGNIVTITGSTITSNSIVIKASDGTYNDTYTIYKVEDGSDGGQGNDGAPAPIAFLTNENITFSANAQGQITTTTITSNIVAYNGTTKVLPTIGTITGIPTGMTITPSIITASNEIMLTIAIANNSTLGSSSNNMGTISIPITSPVSTVLSLTWSKVNTGMTGATGAAGSDAYTVILTNESNTFAGDVSNALAGSTTTQVIAYKGSTAQSVTITSVNGVAASTIDTETGIAGLKFKCSALSGTSPTITFTCTTAFKNANGSIPIVLSVGGISFTKMFTYSIAFKGDVGSTGQTGSPGVPATSYWLISSASAVQKTSIGKITVTPSTLTFTGKSQTGTATPTDYACRWIIAYSTDGTNYTNLYTSSANETSKSVTVATTYKTIRARMYLAGGTSTLLDEQIIPIISDGAKGDTGIGINSVTVTYGESTSASEQPTSWGSDIPDVAEDSYLWTRTVTDYTDDSIADTVTLTYAKQGAKGDTGSSGTSVTVSSIQYQSGTSATTAPTGTWSNSVVTVAEGSYLWTKTTFSDGKIAYGVARQGIDGDDGRGITSIVEQYYQSTSATTQSGGSWSATVPTWVDGKYIWTRSVITYTDSTTSTTSPVCVTGQKGGIGGTGVGVSSVDVWYYQSTSSTALSGGSWSTTAPTWSDGKYVWTKTITTYTNSTTDETAAVCITGQKGATGVGVKSVTEYYLATSSSSGVTTSTSGWTTTVQTIALDKKYLWNYEVITYTNNTTSTTTPIIIGVYGNTGNTGKGIKSVTEYYLATASSSNVTTSTSGWTTTMQTLTSAKKYLWNYELITYTDNTTTTVNPVIIGVYGDQGTPSVTFQIYAQNGYLLTINNSSLTLQTFAYEGSTAITSGATFKWYDWIEDTWAVISGATSNSLSVSKTDVLKSKSYKCEMTYKNNVYVSTATVEDKTDVYESLIRVIAKQSAANRMYWILYAVVYSEDGEHDALLGSISDIEPTDPVAGDYWYKVDTTNYTVTLMKYSGTAWEATTDTQDLLYDWTLFKDATDIVTLGTRGKVKIVTANDFSRVCNVQCNIFNSDYTLFARNSQVLNDPSDPIVSTTEPPNPIDKQLWVKIADNGTYTISIWDEETKKWINSGADSQNKMHTEKPVQYDAGDIWIVGGDYQPTIYTNGVAQTTKYLIGTMLKAQSVSITYTDSDWVEALNYKEDIDDLKDRLNIYNQYFSFDEDGLTMTAKNLNGEISEFKTKLTNTDLGFYQGENKVAYINNNQLNISKAEITNGLAITGTQNVPPTLSIGGFSLIVESNGSLSIGYNA